MDAMGSRVFAVMVNLPRSYMGEAELRVGPDSVTLVARPLRHYYAIVLSYVGAVLVFLAIALFALPGSLELRSVAVGVTAAVLGGITFGFLRLSRGESRTMSLPLASVSLAKRNGRVLILSAAFDNQARSDRWTLAAKTLDDAETIVSSLTAVGG
jgi:4-amino-4-deoxy-L-arabinose transferase-like glycosyltransferase